MGDNNGSAPDVAFLSQKYDEEKAKRLRPEGQDQYVELNSSQSELLRNLGVDPWVDHASLNAEVPNLKDGDEIKFLILGAGFGGLLFGVHFVEQGFKPEDIRIVDVAGGFGGTWYWNRFPGLMCDVESSVYLPLLDKTGYVPKHRYPYGPETLDYINMMAERWGLADKGVFRTTVETCTWDESARRWLVKMTQDRGPNEQPVRMTVKSQFLVAAKGVLNHPKVPKIDGLSDFKGQTIHAARWDYGVSGGSPTDQTLSKLKGKKVGLVGTGCTSVQVLPELAKWAEHVSVFQRTPTQVEERGQRLMDSATWKEITSKPNWARERSLNFAACSQGEPVEEDLVNDGWTWYPVYRHVTGALHKPLAMEEIPQLMTEALVADAPRMERIRKRVEDVVTDKDTAEKLKPWYPTWCKRPSFHDEYLKAFNQSNVTLVDTCAKGVERATFNGLIVDDKEYDLDIIIFATGFRSPAAKLLDTSYMSNTTITGRENTLAERWENSGAATLHGVFTSSFPNLLHGGPSQAGNGPSYTFALDILAEHAAYIVAEATKRTKDPAKVTIEPSVQAEEEWSMKMVMDASWFAPRSTCTPSYLNNEAEQIPPEKMMQAARAAAYSQGARGYLDIIESWRKEGELKGLVIDS